MVDPKYMGIGPVSAIRKVLAKAGLKVEDIDVFEVNEAFAAQALAVVRDLGLPPEKTNPNGSGVALGHPLGATGAILTVKALHELRRIGGRYAVVSMCIGGGQGIAAAFEANELKPGFMCLREEPERWLAAASHSEGVPLGTVILVLM